MDKLTFINKMNRLKPLLSGIDNAIVARLEGVCGRSTYHNYLRGTGKDPEVRQKIYDAAMDTIKQHIYEAENTEAHVGA